MAKIMLEGYECERCGHTWIPRETTEGDPLVCPKCKSPYWNKPRKTETDQAKESLKNKKRRNDN
jgi:DNA-directed RNA polymerase subunit RPC12/RpoP